MDRFVAQQNIKRFQSRLDETADPATRESLSRLIAEAEEQLRRADAAHEGKPHSEPHVRAHTAKEFEVEMRADGPDDDAVRRTGVAATVEQLQLEIEPMQRQSLKRRLVDEEDRFGDLARRMDLVDAYIEDGAHRVAAMMLMTASVSLGGDAARRHASNLNNSREILEILKSYRASLERRADRMDF